MTNANTNHLRRAHEELERAEEQGSSHVREQLQSVDEGIFEETDGERTQNDPGPKDDRIAELEKKLRGLEEQADDPTGTHIGRALGHLDDYRKRWAEES